jgi:hypothetical protein
MYATSELVVPKSIPTMRGSVICTLLICHPEPKAKDLRLFLVLLLRWPDARKKQTQRQKSPAKQLQKQTATARSFASGFAVGSG